MIADLTDRQIELARDSLLTIAARSGFRVTCEQGLVWVTLEGDRPDHWLVAGDALTVAWPGRVVIEAAQASRIALHEPAPATWHFRWPKFGRRNAQQCAA